MLIVAGEVMSAGENVSVLSGDGDVPQQQQQQACRVDSDASACHPGAVHDELTCSTNQSSPAACLTASPSTAAVTDVANSLIDAEPLLQHKLHQSVAVDSKNVPGIPQQVASSSSSPVDSTIMSSSHDSAVLRNVGVSGGGETVSVSEYCQSFEQWLWQYYWWMQHVEWMTWAAYMSVPPPMYTAVSSVPSTVTQPAVTRTMPAAGPAAGLQQPAPQHQPRGPSSHFTSVLQCF